MIPINYFLKRTNTHNKIVFNALLWFCSFIILLYLFSGRSAPEKIDFIYTTCFLITLIIPVSFILYWFIPKFLKKEKNFVFCLLFIVNLIVFATINPFFFEITVNTFFPDYYFISYHNQLEVYFIFFIFFVLSTLLKLGEDWVYLNQVENEVLKSEKQIIEKQLYYLKGQINPHFLFNSLNVLYSLAIDKKEEITNAILQISDILRYVIYDSETDKIPLKKEIELIKNYIAFEKNRHVKNSKISFVYNIDENYEIYPMLLLPLVENSFKHGLKSGIKNPFVKITFIIKNGILNFKIANNYLKNIHSEKELYKGIGLKNIKENLTLIYPKRHTFKIETKEDIYFVNLTINLKNDH